MRYIKKIIEWLAGCFSLVGFVSFLAGFYTLALVDLFYFHKEITPPTYSAAFAGGALMLACYTAIKVNKWLNNKINDKAFKQTEKILEYIEDLHAVLEPLRKRLTLIERAYFTYGFILLSNEQKNEIYGYCDNINSFTEKLVMSTLMLKYWNSKLTETSESKIDELSNKLRELVYSTAPLLESNSDDAMKKNVDQSSKIYLSSINTIREILSLNYDEMFTHNVTSPLKKAD